MTSTTTRRWLSGLAVMAVLAAAGPAFAVEDGAATRSELEALRKAQEEMRARMAEQDARIRELEGDLRAARSGSGAAPAADSAIASELDRYLRARDLTVKGSSTLKFYGFLRLDAIWDDSRASNTQTVGWVRSEDPTAPAGAKKNATSLTIHPRLTRFGVDIDAGRVAAVNDAKVTGKMEVDFYNSGLTGQSESRAALRMRHAYVKLDWGGASLLAGQAADLISPLFPSANPDLVMWGAGNLGDRRPQARVEAEFGGDVKVKMGFMAGLTGADDNQNLDANGYRDGEASARPTLQARTALKFPMGGKNSAEIGLWGHRAWEHTDVKIATTDDFDSVAVGFDWMVPIGSAFSFKGEWFCGRNLDDVRGGIFQGINTVTGDEIHTMGGWVEAGWKVSDTWSLHVGRSQDDVDNGDVGAGGRGRNLVHYVGARLNLDPVEIGIDYMYWFTDWVAQRNGRDNRVQAYIAYKF